MNNAAELVDPEGDSVTASGPELAPTVTAGPVNVTAFGGVPFVEVTEFVRHMSGRRLAGFFLEAIAKADCAIEAPNRGASDAH